MKDHDSIEKARRSFLMYLAASPVLALSSQDVLGATAAELQTLAEDPYIWKPFDPNFLIDKPEDALDVFEFEPVAHKKVPLAHWGFMSTGADSEGTYRANRHDMTKFVMRSRRLRDVRVVDTTREIFGNKWSMPFFLCPTGRQGMYHADGEVGVGRAAGRHNIAQGLATNTSFSITEVNKARNGTPVIFQLYQHENWEISKSLIARAEREGSRAILLTVDGVSARKDMQFARSVREDKRLCLTCHEVRPNNPKSVQFDQRKSPNFSEVPAELWAQKVTRDELTWDYVKRVRDFTKMEVFIKGIMDVEDALLCVKAGCGVYVSNHGGRNEDTGKSSIAAFSEIAPVIKNKAPLFVDGGFRRGMDIVKALSMGATMVGFGRPYLWGLGAFGEAGVDRVIQIMKAEVIAAMQQVGVTSLKELNPRLVQRAI
jgi:isopentenyl diphosphate isomerase/L-lactate dehydrogenase-like FMN-dependent dehydrogenase